MDLVYTFPSRVLASRSMLRPHLFTICLGVFAAAAPASAAEQSVLQGGSVLFDIPAQPLAQALESYSTVTGREILYNGKLVVGRRSTAVNGAYTSQVALSLLLEGTGLSSRSMASDALMLQAVPQPAPQRLVVNAAPPAVVTQYYGLIQSRLKAAFCADGGTQPGAYHVAVSFWIGPAGMVSDVQLLGSTGEPARDAMIDRTLRTLAMDVPPPLGFAQPVTMIIAPWSAGMTRDCQTAPVKALSSGIAP